MTEAGTQDFSFPREARLLRRREFLRLSRTGRKVANAYFLAIVLPGQAGVTRLGVTVTKKIGGAVTRNRIKRRTREFFRQNRHRLNGVWDINIIARKPSAGLSSHETFAALESLLERIGR